MPESSREEIAKLEALYANNPAGRVFTHLAEAYRKAGEYEHARGILEDGLQKHPGYASAYVVLGRVFMDLQENVEAEDAFRRVLDLDPHNMVALRSLGELARNAGRNDEARSFFEQLRQQDPGSEEIEQIINDLSAPEERSVTVEYSAPGEEADWLPESTSYEPAPPDATESVPDITPTVSDDSEPESWTPFADEPAAEFDAAPVETPEQRADNEDFQLGWVPAEAEKPAAPLASDLGEITSLSAAAEKPHWQSDEAVDDELGDLSSIGAAAQEFEIEGETFAPEDLDLGVTDTGESEPSAYEDSTADGEVLTETIAELYRRQGLYDRAADVYRALLRERPGDPELHAKLAEVEGLMRPTPEPEQTTASDWHEPEQWEPPEADAEDAAAWLVSGAETAESTPPTPYAWTEQTPEVISDTGRPISVYFQALLSWQPRQAPPESQEATPPDNAFDQWFGVAEPTVPEPAAAAATESSSPEPESGESGEADDDDDLEMFRSWLQSLKK